MATQGEIARHLDLSERQINNLQKLAGFPVPQGRGQYDLDACRLWYIRYLRTAKPGSSEPEMEGDESSKTLDRQKAELANEYRQEQIENLRLRRMVLSKQYAPITVLSAVLLQWRTAREPVPHARSSKSPPFIPSRDNREHTNFSILS